ncbi:MAG: T9SS type A sorting domain-containing protein [Chitinophagales bacterium]|nr:T9SS type A sorting domain-containing protein [Chitinophagales bacterium]
MKTRLLTLFALLSITFSGKAQYVPIPDVFFRDYLGSRGVINCWQNGYELDTTCPEVLNLDYILCNNLPIRDLTGVQYFKNLNFLDCSNDSISIIPALPPRLKSFYCEKNLLTGLPALPDSIEDLSCANNALTSLPSLPASLTTLNCSFNNSLTALPTLPPRLFNLECGFGGLTRLPALPAGLLYLRCSYSAIDSLPALPDSLQQIDCQANQISNMPALPNGLIALNCQDNHIPHLGALPDSLKFLVCGANQIDSIPALPANLSILSISLNPLVKPLPPLPATLTELGCLSCNLNSLPALPARLTKLDCSSNQLTSLPELPDSLYWLRTDNNPALRCLPQLKRINSLSFTNTGVTCLPNYGNVTSSTPPLANYPLCNLLNNTGCNVYWNISGNTFYDTNNNCQLNSGEPGSNYVKVMLYSSGVLKQQTFTGGEGFYSFDTTNGTYSLGVDTTNLPFTVSCPANGIINQTLTPANPFSTDNNFAFKCKTTGHDLGVHHIINNVVVPRPTAVISVQAAAGDMSQLYGARCGAGITGTVQLTYSGQLQYVGAGAGGISPTAINGNTLTWSVADFGLFNISTAINCSFKIDSFATPGSQACFTVTTTPSAGDYNPANNSAQYCFTIVNSLDPNDKAVSPAVNIDTLSGWLTYLVRFQNTGTASALNVYIKDTLDNALDPATFQLLAYSHQNVTQLKGNIVTFNFPNIDLPDSNTNEALSHGYVQYKVKLKPGRTIGSQVKNTAFIYFDLNPAVVTNTVTNTIISCSPQTYALTQSICAGRSFTFGGQQLSSAGSYTDTLQSASGCDSIVLLNLSVDNIISQSITGNICAGDVYAFGTQNLTAAGTYKDTLSATGGCDSIVTLTLGVNALPQPVVTRNSNVISTQVFSSYQWLKNGAAISGALAQDYTITDSGDYGVIVTDANGCSDTSAIQYLLVTGIAGIVSDFGIRLYPNPNNGTFVIEALNANTSEIQITDIQGKVVADKLIVVGKKQLIFADIESGVYLLHVKQNDGVNTIRFTVFK